MRCCLSVLAVAGSATLLLSVAPVFAEAHRHAGHGAHATPQRSSGAAPRGAHGQAPRAGDISNQEQEVESEGLFGFTAGSDTANAGAIGVAFESVARLGKREGRYRGIGKKLELGYGVTDDVSVSLGLLSDYRRIVGVAGLDDVSTFGFNGIGGEFRWRLVKREPGQFGMTLQIEPSRRRYDELTGQRVEKYGVENKLIFDTELVPDKVFAAFNLLYDVERVRARGQVHWEQGSTLGLAAAVSVQVARQTFLGGEVRYLRAYEGLLPKALAGEAVFMGPMLFRHFANHVWISAAWNVQVAGHAVGHAGRLDLVNFERHQMRVKAGIDFEPEKAVRREGD